MRLKRKSHLLNDAIEGLDEVLKKADGDIPAAWALLSPVEFQFIREEIGNCISSRVYYLNNYHTVQPERGEPIILADLWDHQWMVEIELQRLIREQGWAMAAVLKPRQAGITEYATGVMCHCTFFTPHAYTVSIAQDPDVASHVQRKINLCWERLPWWLRPERQYHSKGEFLEFNRKDESSRIADPGLASVYVTTHAQRTSGVAVGRTVRFLHLSECCYWADGEVYTSDVEPTLNAPDKICIAESTGLRNSGFWYNFWNECVDHPEDTDWTPVFLPAYRARKYAFPIKPGFKLTEAELAVRERVQAEEDFIISEEFFNWRRRRIASAIRRTGFPYAHYAAYPIFASEAFQSSSLGAFPRHKLDEQEQRFVCVPRWHGEISFMGLQAAPKLQLEELRDADGKLYPGLPPVLPKRDKYNRLWVWEQPRSGATYYLSADASAGKEGNDYACATVYRAASGNQPDVMVAEFHGWISPTEFAQTLYALGTYYNKCEIAVEYEKEGMITADTLVKLEYPSLYRPRRSDIIGGNVTRLLHWSTNYKTKRMAIVTMREALLTNTVVLRSSLLLSQMRKFVATSLDDNDIPISYGGDGENDDAVMSAVIGLCALRLAMPELRAYQEGDEQDSASNRSKTARPSGGMIYGVYDEFMRQRGQYPDLSQAQDVIKANAGWFIKPIQVSRVNTMYSVIHHGHGLENEMLRQGEDSWNILPGAVSAYAQSRGARAADGRDSLSLGAGVEEWNRMLTGEVWGDWRD